jgi:hypothetical protein
MTAQVQCGGLIARETIEGTSAKTIKSIDHVFICGVAVPDGYVLTGSTSSGEQSRNQLSPWIELIDI